MRSRLRQILLPILISVYFLTMSGGYALTVPPFENPDEYAHFLVAHAIVTTGSLPTIATRDTISNAQAVTDRWAVHNHHPPLYYALAALLIAPIATDDLASFLRVNPIVGYYGTADTTQLWVSNAQMTHTQTWRAVMTLRLANVLTGLATLWVIYLALRWVCQGTSAAVLPALTMLFCASIPAYGMVSAAISNDPLVILLFSLGVWWVMCLWTRRRLRWQDVGLAAVLLSAIALTKLTGLVLIVVIYGGVTGAAWRGWISWSRAGVFALVTASVILLCSGWWFWRNQSLYGDFFAISATQALWQRQEPVTSATFINELGRIWQTLWLPVGLGNRLLPSPVWLLPWMVLLNGMGVAGWVRRRYSIIAPQIVWLWLGSSALVLAVLVWGTLRVDVSYGRLLFPALIAFAPLLLLGVWRLIGRWVIVLIALLSLANILMLSVYVPLAYPTLTTPATLPATVMPLSLMTGSVTEGVFTSDGFRVDGIEWLDEVVSADQTLHLRVYFTGRQPQSGAWALRLMGTQADGNTVLLKQTIAYPANTASDTLSDVSYSALMTLPIGTVPQGMSLPQQTQLMLQILNPQADFQPIALRSADGTVNPRFLIAGPVLVDPITSFAVPAIPAQVTFTTSQGDILLQGADFAATATRGSTLPLRLYWESTLALPADYVTIVHLAHQSSDYVIVADQPPPYYPTTSWLPQRPWVDTRTLHIPDDAPLGNYTLRIGWYVPGQDERLPASGNSTQDALWQSPHALSITVP